MATYKPLQSVALTSDTSSIIFSGIDQGYTDLILVMNTKGSVSNYCQLRFNGDTGTNYSRTDLKGNGTTAASSRDTNRGIIDIASNATNDTSNFNTNIILHINNYSNTTTYKTALSRANNAGAGTDAVVVLWRSTAAINSIYIAVNTGNFAAGSTFDLYGIKSGAPQALGGDVVVTDGTYWYHAFLNTGTFTPLKTITCDYLVVAGGGGGGRDGYSGNRDAGGGGAGGLRGATSQSLSAANYTVTIGAGGAGGSGTSSGVVGTSGTSSSFNSLSTTGGGGGGGHDSGDPYNGLSGGSGGGAPHGATAGSGNSGGYSPVEGYAGGVGYSTSSQFGGGGGGGAGAVGANATSSASGNGGAGSSSYSSWGSATNTGQNSAGTYYYAGGGGGGGVTTNGTGGVGGGANGGSGAAGTANTGGGGGAGRYANSTNGGTGGSGIVIVRYAV